MNDRTEQSVPAVPPDDDDLAVDEPTQHPGTNLLTNRAPEGACPRCHTAEHADMIGWGANDSDFWQCTACGSGWSTLGEEVDR